MRGLALMKSGVAGRGSWPGVEAAFSPAAAVAADIIRKTPQAEAATRRGKLANQCQCLRCVAEKCGV